MAICLPMFCSVITSQRALPVLFIVMLTSAAPEIWL